MEFIIFTFFIIPLVLVLLVALKEYGLDLLYFLIRWFISTLFVFGFMFMFMMMFALALIMVLNLVGIF